MKFVVFLFWMMAGMTYVYAIPCNFTYIDAATENSSTMVFPGALNTKNKIEVKKGDEKFQCDNEIYDEYERDTSVPIEVIANRINIDEYEREEPICTESKKLIQPKGLNNIYNKFITVDQIVTVQKIEFTQCIVEEIDCSRGSAPADKKVICYQEFTKIQLKAIGENNKPYNELFYYPSACSCVTFKKKQK